MEEESARHISPAEGMANIHRSIDSDYLSALSDAEIQSLLDDYIESRERAVVTRHILSYDSEGHYRYETLQPFFPSIIEPDQTVHTMSSMVVQGDERNWYVQHDARNVEVRSGNCAAADVFPMLSNGWSDCDYFLDLRGPINTLTSVRGVASIDTQRGLVTAWATLPEDSVKDLGFGYRRGDEDALLDWFFLTYRPDRSASLYRLSDWEEFGGIQRPRSIEINRWTEVDVSIPLTPDSLSSLAPTHVRSLRILDLKFNEPIQREMFTFDPPSDYAVAELQEDGSWVTIPSAHDYSDLPHPVNVRQQVIRDRISHAESPQNITVYLLVGGGGILLLGVALAVWRNLKG